MNNGVYRELRIIYMLISPYWFSVLWLVHAEHSITHKRETKHVH